MRLLQNLVFLALVIVMAPVALLGFVCKAASIAFRVGVMRSTAFYCHDPGRRNHQVGD